LLEHITNQQGEGDAPTFEGELLIPRVHCHVLRQQRLAVSGKLWPQADGTGQVIAVQGEFLDADEMKPGVCVGMLREQLPGAVEIHAGAKARLADDHAGMGRHCSETFRQAGLSEKHMAGFIDAFVDGEVHVIVMPRMRAALFVPVDLGVLERGRYGHGGCAATSD